MGRKKHDLANTIAPKFGQRLRKLRTMTSLTQNDIEDLTGIQSYLISRYETGNFGALPALRNVVKLADLFGVSKDWLLSPDHRPEDDDTNIDIVRINKLKGRKLLLDAMHYFSDIPQDKRYDTVLAVERFIAIIADVYTKNRDDLSE